MKKMFVYVVALSMLATAFSSCEKDAPEINFSQTTTIGFDLTPIVNALNDMSVDLSRKIDLVVSAINDQKLSITQKLQLLEAVINTQGTNMAGKLDIIEAAINSQAQDIDAQLALIKGALDSGLLPLSGKLDLIKGAIDSQAQDIDAQLALIKGVLDDNLVPMKGKVDLIYDLLNSKLVSLEGKLEAIDKGINDPQVGLTAKLGVMQSAIENKILESQEAIKSAVAQTLSSSLTALQDSMNDQYDVIAQKLDTINMALKLANVEAGIMEGSTRNELLMLPESYKVLYYDKALKDAFMKIMITQTPETMTLLVQPNNVTYDITPTWDDADLDLFYKSYMVKSDQSVPHFGVVKHHLKVTCDVPTLPSSVVLDPNKMFVEQLEASGGLAYNGHFINLGEVTGATTFFYRYYYQTVSYEGYPNMLSYTGKVLLNQ